MMRKLSVGLVATALVLSGAMVGVSYGGPGGITEPEVIELDFSFCEPGPCRFYVLRDSDGGRTGQVTLGKFPLFDVDGNRVGLLHESCVNSDGPGGETPWFCTFVHTLRAGPYTESGTVVTTGILTFGEISRFAVTGGTGAYVNVRGYAELDGQGPGYTLHLIP